MGSGIAANRAGIEFNYDCEARAARSITATLGPASLLNSIGNDQATRKVAKICIPPASSVGISYSFDKQEALEIRRQ